MSYTITETKTLYTFDELSDEAKEQAKSELLEDPWYFWTDLDAKKSWIIDPFFTNGNRPEWQAAFSFCQGDGLNLYGELSYNDLRNVAGLKPVKNDFTVNIPANRQYTYCMWGMGVYYHDIYEALAENNGLNQALRQKKSIRAIETAMQQLCKELREYGEYLIFEGYLDPSIYESRLFDQSGHWVCSIDDIKEEA